MDVLISITSMGACVVTAATDVSPFIIFSTGVIDVVVVTHASMSQ